MKKNYLAYALWAILAFALSACNLGTNQAGEVSVEPTPVITQTLDVIQQNEAERSASLTAEVASPAPSLTSTATLIPTLAPTNTPLPTFTPVPPTAEPRDFSEYPNCLEVTEKSHPDSGEELINKVNPYPGVSLEVQIYSKVDCVFVLKNGEFAPMADWYHGQPDPVTGGIIGECPTGPECEGVSVLFRSDVIPAYTIVHLFVNPDSAVAVSSFLGTKNVRSEERGYWDNGDSSSFACRYLKNSQQYGVHNNENIRVPEWAKDSASIFFHTGCVDFDGDPGYDNPEPATITACAAPTNDTWTWYETGGFWFYDGFVISFVAPSHIDKVLYRATDSGYVNKVATTGETVSAAVHAFAYCE